MEKKKSDIMGVCGIGILVVISIFFAYGRFLDDSLRFDEAMEYWISYMDFKDMYGMINTTYQPPVYNVVMHFWLQISESIIWFKLSNVFFYGIGMIGLLKTVQYVCGNRCGLVIATIVPVCFSAMLYYNQICGEYVLVLPILFWLVYSALKTIKEKGWKEFIFFAFLAVLAMGTQYGAMFTIFGAGMVMLIAFIKQKDWKALKKLIVTGVTAIVGFMLPLFYFFTRHQMVHQSKTTSNLGIKAIVAGLYNAFEFMLYAWDKEYENRLNLLLVCLVIVCIVSAFIIYKKENKKEIKEKYSRLVWMIGICFITVIGYALGVAIGFYGYGDYASRHTVLVLPVIITAIACTLSKLWEDSKKNYIYKVAVVVSAVFLVGNSYHYVWQQHWNYDQIDTAMETIKQISDDTPVWLEFWAVPTALAYGEDDIEKRLEIYLSCLGKGKTEKVDNIIYTATEDILKDFGGELPEKCYILVSDKTISLDKVEELRVKYEAKGWSVECVHPNIPSIMAAGTQVWLFDKNETD